VVPRCRAEHRSGRWTGRRGEWTPTWSRNLHPRPGVGVVLPRAVTGVGRADQDARSRAYSNVGCLSAFRGGRGLRFRRVERTAGSPDERHYGPLGGRGTGRGKDHAGMSCTKTSVTPWSKTSPEMPRSRKMSRGSDDGDSFNGYSVGYSRRQGHGPEHGPQSWEPGLCTNARRHPFWARSFVRPLLIASLAVLAPLVSDSGIGVTVPQKVAFARLRNSVVHGRRSPWSPLAHVHFDLGGLRDVDRRWPLVLVTEQCEVAGLG